MGALYAATTRTAIAAPTLFRSFPPPPAASRRLPPPPAASFLLLPPPRSCSFRAASADAPTRPHASRFAAFSGNDETGFPPHARRAAVWAANPHGKRTHSVLAVGREGPKC